MSRLTKLDRMTHAEKEAAKKVFWEAADNQTFPPETVAIVMHVSLPWLQKKRCEGGGIPFSKPHKRQVNYMKSDVLAYIEQNKMAHTA
ncbi:DNA-binding protein [Acinetobacter baumannii]|uniref:DNA-binding protein n=1 Tax=Acinetobacter baumannii TaxID=470 RepID=UPI0027BD8426|nr:DNA-binding protein [Acinetobacter baumannii]MDQ2614283.1 DNA-binding protein [Acinetobacter baumannii]